MKISIHQLFFVFCLAAVGSLTMQAQQKVSWVFMPQWTPQAQFAGYYVAYQKGFYAQQGINLTIDHISPYATTIPLDLLMEGKVDIIVQKLQQTVIKRSEGYKILNILQASQNSGLMCVSRSPISSPTSLNGLKVGQWKTGHGELCQMMEKENHLNITWIPFLQSMNLFVAGAIDATLCYSYNEYFSLIFSLGEISPEKILRFSKVGYNFPEDAICVTESFYKANKQMLDRFNLATKRGWEYAAAHPQETLDIVMEYVNKGKVATNRYHQQLMLQETLNLQINPRTNERDFAPMPRDAFNDMVKRMLNDSIIMKSVKYEEVIR